MNEKFTVIYADPPWRYEQKNVHGSAEHHYPTMSIEEICSLPVKNLAAKDCVLFLWVTFPQLPEAFKVIEAWGFSYRSVAFVWVKKKQTLLLLVLWLGLLDQRKCGNLSAGSKRAPQTQIGFCSSTDCFPHRAAQQKAG